MTSSGRRGAAVSGGRGATGRSWRGPASVRRWRGEAALAALAAAAAIWAAALVAAPWTLAHRAPEGPAFVAAAGVYVVGDYVCHQQSARSFHLWDVKMPVCARCAGLYAAAPGGALLALLWLPAAPGGARRRGWRPARSSLRRLLIAAAVPTLLTVAFEVPNAPRALSALPLGFAVAWLAARTAREALAPEPRTMTADR